MYQPDQTLQTFTNYKDLDACPSGSKVVVWMMSRLALVAVAIYLV